jgi:allophanate hydrolase
LTALGLATSGGLPGLSLTCRRGFKAVAKLRARRRHQSSARPISISSPPASSASSAPYGIRQSGRADLIPGGSSFEGSAARVPLASCRLALGTYTAGSGRVPAMLNNIVGLKPSLG